MKFLVRIPKEVEDEIASWNLSNSFRKRLYETLRDELGDRSDDAFPRFVLAPVRCAILPFTVIEPETGEEREFLAWVNITTELGVRIVLRCAPRGNPVA